MDTTPNFALSLPPADRRNWTDIANGNFTLIDAIMATFVAVHNLKGIWTNNTVYLVGDNVIDEDSGVVWTNQIQHTTASAPGTFLNERTAQPTYWTTFSVAASNRGAWATGTSYNLNDFVVNGSQYAVCIAAHTSGVTFAADLALGRWSVLVDLSAAGSLVLPILAGAGDANKFAAVNASGTAYIIINQATALANLGATSVGIPLLQAASIVAARTTLGLGTAATLDAGVIAGNLVQMAAGPKLPAVDGSALTNLPGSLSSTTFLGSDVIPGTSNFADIVNSGSIGAAGQTWLLIGTVVVRDTAAGANIEAGIFNGSSYITNALAVSSAANIYTVITVCAVVVLGAATTFTLRVKDQSSANLVVSTTGLATGTANKATSLTAVRLG